MVVGVAGFLHITVTVLIQLISILLVSFLGTNTSNSDSHVHIFGTHDTYVNVYFLGK